MQAEARIDWRVLVESARLVSAASGRDLDATLDALCEQVRRLFSAADVVINLAAPDGAELMHRRPSRLWVPESASPRPGTSYTPSQFVLTAIDSRRPLFSPDYQADPRMDPAGKKLLRDLVATMTVPLIADSALVGAMFVHWTRQLQLGAEQLELADALGRHAAVAIGTSRALERAREAERAARRTAVEIEAILDAVTEIVLVYGTDERLLRANRSARDLLSEWIGPIPNDLESLRTRLNAMSLDGTPMRGEGFARALGGLVTEAEMLVHPPGDRQRHLLARMGPVLGDDGVPRAVLYVARDITDLYDAIAERGRLDGSIKTARAIAHELGNHLAVLAVNGEMLADSASEEDADLASQVTRATRRTRDTLDRLQRIVRFEEIDGGGGPMLDLDAATRQ